VLQDGVDLGLRNPIIHIEGLLLKVLEVSLIVQVLILLLTNLLNLIMINVKQFSIIALSIKVGLGGGGGLR